MASQTRPSVSVVVRAFNESRRITSTILTLKKYLEGKRIAHELIIVHDGSTDDTLSMAQRAAGEWPDVVVLSLPSKRGKGWAVREGTLRAKGDVVLFTDADLSTPVEETEKFLNQIDMGCNVVIGTRKARGARIDVRQPRLREWLGRGYSWLANHITGAGVSDFTCGFKAFRLKAAQEIFPRQRLEGWSFDAEVLFLASRCGLRIGEVPVQWRNNPETKVRLIRDMFRSFADLLLIRVYEMLGRYD